MYERHFGLERRPFIATPDPDCFVPTEAADQVLDELIRCIEAGEGIAVLTGPAGVGKTLICRRLAEELSDPFAAVFLPNSNYPTRRSLLQAILYELERPYLRMAEQELRLELTSAVRELCATRQALVLVVDEAHLLSARLLEEIRSITNLADDGSPLVRVVLSGQLQLEENLAEPELASLNQRIACQVSLAPLSHKESAEYISARLEWAGGTPAEIFTPRALQVICQASDGSPRCINQLCDHSLMLGFVAGERPIGPETVYEALEDLKQLPLHWNVPTAIPSPIEQLQSQAEQFRASKRDRNDSENTRVKADVASRGHSMKEKEVESFEIGGDDSESIAAIEIGGPEPTFKQPGSKPSISVGATGLNSAATESQRSIVSPAAPRAKSASSVGREFQEEVVVDRYALLDAMRPARPALLAPKTLPLGIPSSGKPSGKALPKETPITTKQQETARKVPTARDLDLAIEGIMSLVDEALDPSGDGGMSGSTNRGIIVESQDAGALASLTISVETDATGNLRVQDVGRGTKSISAGESHKSTVSRDAARGSQNDVQPRAFDIVLPDDDDTDSSSTARVDRAGEQPAVAETTPPAPRPHRPYEQLFSELRRRRGA